MDNFAPEELVHLFKLGILWFIVTVMFCTRELKEEAYRHFHHGVIRVPGVCYGTNIIKGYRAIGRFFPDRCRTVRLDYLFGYFKLALLTACIAGLIIWAGKLITG